VILVCRLDGGDKQKAEATCSGSGIITLMNLSIGEHVEDEAYDDDEDPVEEDWRRRVIMRIEDDEDVPCTGLDPIDYPTSFLENDMLDANDYPMSESSKPFNPLFLKKLMQHLGLGAGEHTCMNPTPAHFLAFLLSICSNYAGPLQPWFLNPTSVRSTPAASCRPGCMSDFSYESVVTEWLETGLPSVVNLSEFNSDNRLCLLGLQSRWPRFVMPPYLDPDLVIRFLPLIESITSLRHLGGSCPHLPGSIYKLTMSSFTLTAEPSNLQELAAGTGADEKKEMPQPRNAVDFVFLRQEYDETEDPWPRFEQMRSGQPGQYRPSPSKASSCGEVINDDEFY
jgi:hypothetical protein